jgi:hypothetical protein
LIQTYSTHLVLVLVVGKASKVLAVNLAATDQTTVLLVVLSQALSVKVVAGEIHDTATAVRKTAKSKAVLVVVAKRVIVIEVEGAFLALALLPFTGVTLEHTVFERHCSVIFTKTTITERSRVVAEVVLLKEGLATLLETGLASRRRATSDALQLATPNIVLGLVY